MAQYAYVPLTTPEPAHANASSSRESGQGQLLFLRLNARFLMHILLLFSARCFVSMLLPFNPRLLIHARFLFEARFLTSICQCSSLEIYSCAPYQGFAADPGLRGKMLLNEAQSRLQLQEPAVCSLLPAPKLQEPAVRSLLPAPKLQEPAVRFLP